ncbi:MAG: hypothetical protein AAF680_06630 [Pseudomonadota bacterium]
MSNGRLDKNTDRIDRLVADWYCERPDLGPSPMEVVGRVSRVGGQLDTWLDECE